MGLFTNKETDYFGLFEQSIAYSCQAAHALRKAFVDGLIDTQEIKNLKDIEHEADNHVHRCLKLIEEAFITPIDRSDIMEIVKQIENITDNIDSIANHTYMMCVKEVNEPSRYMMDLVVQACTKLQEMMKLLKSFKKNLKAIDELIIEVNHIEEEGDKTYLNAMRALFEHETDAKKIIVFKLLYEKLETALDTCEDVADMIQKIIIAST
jgi:predicted phosphate transport protein (TIGR00153 family)